MTELRFHERRAQFLDRLLGEVEVVLIERVLRVVVAPDHAGADERAPGTAGTSASLSSSGEPTRTMKDGYRSPADTSATEIP